MDQSQIFAVVVAALSTVVSGGIGASGVFGAIELLSQYVTLSSTAKRNLAPALSLVIPPLAYAILIALTHQAFDGAVLCMAVFVGYVGAKRIHDSLEAAQNGAQAQVAETPAQ